MKNILLFLVISCFSILRFEAQSLGKVVDISTNPDIPFTVRQYTTDDGLPQSQILEIIQTANRELILTTANGIVKFNGTEFYPFLTGPDYNKYFFSALMFSEDGQKLYGSSASGVFLLKPYFGLIRSYIRTFFPDKKTMIGITNKGIVYKEKLSDHSRIQLIKTPIQNTTFIYQSDNWLFIATNNTTYIFDLTTKKIIQTINDNVRSISKNPYTGELYACGAYDVYRYNNKKLEPLHLNKQPDNRCKFNNVAFLSATQIMISSYCGLFYYEKNKKAIQYTKNQALPTNIITNLYLDTIEYCLFAGTGDRGLLKLQLKNIQSIYQTANSETNSASAFSSILTLPDKQVYAAAGNGTIYIIKEKYLSPYISDINLDFASMSYFRGNFFLGTWGSGILILKNKQIQASLKIPTLKSNTVTASFVDHKGQYWIGHDNGMSYGKSLKTLHPAFTKTINEFIVSIYELRNGTICAGGDKNIYFIKDNKILRKIGKSDGLECRNVRAFYEDNAGKLWIGTYNGGLYCYHNNKLKSINKMENCTLDQNVFTLAKDGYGNFLISSNHGIWMISEKKLNDFYYGNIDYLIPFFFGEESGIYNPEFNGGFQNNFASTSPFTFYFPSIQGVVRYNAEKIQFRKLIPVIKSVIVDDSVYVAQNARFPRTTKSIRFDFFATSYLSKYNTYYQYRLIDKNNKDKKWNLPQKMNSVSFLMLPPGEYTIQIRALDGFNDANPKTCSYHFTIIPFFYETYWFILLTSLLLIGMIILIIRLRMNYVRKKTRREHKIQTTMLELRLEAIHSKMNPHFIFNSLNNIIYLLNFEKFQEAEVLLQDFSLLLRKFLENSDLTFNDVKSELEIIHLYLDIEKRRFNDRFNFEITFDPELANQQVPTMLLQPFIENAIKHGISHLDEPGKITIGVHQVIDNDKKFIRILIEDNGIGREKSLEINKSRKNHSSKGIALVREKIALVKRQSNLTISLKITDINNDGQTGTIIEMQIPLYD